MIRAKCVICNTTNFETIYTKDNFPVCISSTSDAYDTDKFHIFELVGCNICQCVQLRNLIDPELLYKNSHNITYNTPTWSKHHKGFAKFILTNLETPELLIEIGGQNGVLAEHILSKISVPYTIVDLCDEPPALDNVSFINANCETYDYPLNATVVLSHVFEHLYNPLQFIERLSKSNVKSVFISIPNMEQWLSNKVLSFLHVEHTYYCDSFYICDMFSRYGYKCTKQENFLNHSVWYQFDMIGCEYIAPIGYPKIIEKFKLYISARDINLDKLFNTNPTFIFPAGHYGQLVYHSIKGDKRNIISFLDNDPSKFGKRVYGTPCETYSPSVLKGLNGLNITIILCASVYSDEIKRQLETLNKSLTIIEV